MKRYYETERLILRSPIPTDAPDISKVRNSDFVQRYNLYTDSSTEDVLAELERYDLVILLEKHTGRFLGLIHIKEDYIRYHVDSMELAGWLDMSVAKQGFMSEALRGLIPNLFNEGIARLTARVFSDNLASVRLMESIGFVREGYLREAVKNSSGEIFDMILFSVTEEEFKKRVG